MNSIYLSTFPETKYVIRSSDEPVRTELPMVISCRRDKAHQIRKTATKILVIEYKVTPPHVTNLLQRSVGFFQVHAFPTSKFHFVLDLTSTIPWFGNPSMTGTRDESS